MRRRILVPLFFLIAFPFFTEDTAAAALPYTKDEFPQWALDLRRAEIIGFGIFPFAVFFSTFGFDTYRFIANGFDMIYAPWPFKPDSAYNPKAEEKFLTIGIAVGLSLVAVGVDFYLGYLKKQEAARKTEAARGEKKLPAGKGDTPPQSDPSPPQSGTSAIDAPLPVIP